MARDVEITLVVSRENLPRLEQGVPCLAVKLVRQRGGVYALAVHTENRPPASALGVTEGSFERLGARP